MAYLEKYGYPHIDWDQHRDALDALAPEAAAARREELIMDWLAELNGRMDNACSLVSNGQLIYFSYLDAKTASQRLRKMSEIRQELIGEFGEDLLKGQPGKNLVVELDTLDAYYDYLTYFYELGDEDETEELIETPMTAGCMVSAGYPQIVLNHFAKGNLTKIFAHELMHVFTAPYRLPNWLGEGLSTCAEALAGGQSSYGISPYNKDYHDQYWTAAKLADFWAGQTFKEESGFHLSYDLSYMVTQNLLASGIALGELLTACGRHQDQADFRERTGVDPFNFVPQYIRTLVAG
jgi:hypothetical protein